MTNKISKFFWFIVFSLHYSSWSMEQVVRLEREEKRDEPPHSYQYLSFENVPELYPDFFSLSSIKMRHNASLVCQRWYTIVSKSTQSLHLVSPWVADYVSGGMTRLVKRFSNIRTLVARCNDQLEDQHLQHLTQLTTLDMSLKEYIGGCGINSMPITDDGISKLTNLTSLNLCGHEGITNRGICHLTKLKGLNLSGENNGYYRENYESQINLDGIVTLTNLTKLSLKNNNSIPQQGCLILPMLNSLSLSCNSVMDDVALKKMTGLTELNISSNDTISDNGLGDLVQLKVLNIAWNDLITNRGLAPLTALTELNLRFNNQITSDCLENFLHLRTLRLHMNSQIPDKFLLKLSTLTSLDLSGSSESSWCVPMNGISDLSVDQMSSLICLNLDYNLRISNQGIYGLTNLQKLGASHCSQFLTEEAINSLINLTALNVDWERELHIEKLSHLTKLKWLNVSWSIKQKVPETKFRHLFNDQINVRSNSHSSHKFFKEIDRSSL